jgi:Flp pilus assembly protein TadD
MSRVAQSRRGAGYFMARAQMLDAAGKGDDAINSIDEAIQASPNRADLYWQAAVLLSRNGRGPEALQLLDRGAKILPQDPQIPLVKATLLEAAGQSEAAEHLLNQIQRRSPEGSALWVARGIILSSHGQFENARRALETAVTLGARSPEAFYYLADSTMRSAPDRTADVEAAIRNALKLAPEDQWIKALAHQIANRQGDSKTPQESPIAAPDPHRLFHTRPPQDW